MILCFPGLHTSDVFFQNMVLKRASTRHEDGFMDYQPITTHQPITIHQPITTHERTTSNHSWLLKQQVKKLKLIQSWQRFFMFFMSLFTFIEAFPLRMPYQFGKDKFDYLFRDFNWFISIKFFKQNIFF